MSKRVLPEINAGSMADIAFLLLIFFLVTTTMDVDSGIMRKIPPKQDHPTVFDVKEKNIMEVNINKNNEVLIDDELVEVSAIKQLALHFIDNGGGVDTNNTPCTWCKGEKDPTSSDHPQKAIVSISADRAANYETYVNVLDNINGAYTVLRNRVSKELYGTSYNELLAQLQNETKNKQPIISKIKTVRSKYPLLISDAEIQD